MSRKRLLSPQIIVICLTLVFTSCASLKLASLTENGPRTLVLDGDSYSEELVDSFISWTCYDFINTETLGKGPIRLEVGFFGKEKYSGLGFLLYDGGYSGVLTSHNRNGLEHRWNWGQEGNEYSFIIKTDGTGLYYDFTTAKETKPRELYGCKKQ